MMGDEVAYVGLKVLMLAQIEAAQGLLPPRRIGRADAVGRGLAARDRCLSISEAARRRSAEAVVLATLAVWPVQCPKASGK